MASRGEMIKGELRDGEAIIACTISDDELAAEFDDFWHRGAPFTAWSETRVFFADDRGGSAGIGSAPRNPSASSFNRGEDRHG